MVSLLFSTVFTTYNNVAAARRSKHATSERLMVEAIPLAEAFRILILPPISRGTHFSAKWLSMLLQQPLAAKPTSCSRSIGC
jgi:hypothetical protein